MASEDTPSKESHASPTEAESSSRPRTEDKRSRQPARKPATRRSQASKVPPLWQMIVLVVLLGAVGAMVILKGHLSPAQLQFFRIVISLFAAGLVISGTSQATVEWKHHGIEVRLTGASAIAVAVYLVLHFFVPSEASRPVNVYLNFGDKPLLKNFRITARVPGQEDVSKSGENGSAIIIVPARVEEVDLTVSCPGFRPKYSGPYKVQNGAIHVILVKTGNLPPLDPKEFPSEESMPDRPGDEPQKRPSRFHPGDVVFRYMNATDTDLRLLVFNCSRSTKKEGFIRNSPWSDWRFPAQDEFLTFSGFRSGTGWFCFWVMDEANTKHYLGCQNLFEAEITSLVVSKTDDPLKPYRAKFSTEQ